MLVVNWWYAGKDSALVVGVGVGPGSVNGAGVNVMSGSVVREK